MRSKWRSIGGTLMIGLPSVAKDMDFAGDGFPATSSLALTAFLIGYALAN